MTTAPDRTAGETAAGSTERERIEAAIKRLLHGQPLRSTGALTVIQLAAEADVKRWVLTHRHTDLMHSFQAAVRQQQQESPLVTPWRERVQQLEIDNAALRTENADLRATVEIYAQVIDDLNRAVDQLATKTEGASAVRRIR